MRLFLCVALLCAVGCSSVPAANMEGDQELGLAHWIPETFSDLWDCFDGNVGLDYGFGAHFKMTEMFRLGIFDYSDFSLLGFTATTFDGVSEPVNMEAWNNNGAWDLSAKFGMGLGGMARVNTWEIFDFISTLVTLNFFSFDED
jgi:hypothetical protein